MITGKCLRAACDTPLSTHSPSDLYCCFGCQLIDLEDMGEPLDAGPVHVEPLRHYRPSAMRWRPKTRYPARARD